MRIDRTSIDCIFITPNILQKRLSRESPASVLNKRSEQFEFCGREIQSRAVDRDLEISFIHAELIYRQDRRIPDDTKPPKQILDAQNQLAWAERFRDIIVHSELQARNPIGNLGLSSENQDRNIRSFVRVPQRFANFYTGHLRQHDIENDCIGSRLGGSCQAGRTIQSSQDVKTRPAKMISDQVNDIRFVFDN